MVALSPWQDAARATSPAAAPSPSGVVEQWTVTLITGDTVAVWRNGAGDYSASVPRGGGFSMTEVQDHLYVVPDDAVPLLHSVLEPELFDVRALVEQGLDDSRARELPVLVEQAGAESASRLEATTGGSVDAGRVLPAAGVVAASVSRDGSDAFARQLAERAEHPRRRASASARGVGGITHVWLDRQLEVTWEHNLEQVGAPAAWRGGATGADVTLAVLDTGSDPTHPDLAGKVLAAADFTGAGTTADGHGHGTHVAAIAAGSGAGNDGQRRGVAPDADLLVGKVMRDDGTGSASAIIAGMQWATAQGADVVNMSIGGAPSDGKDPLSTAVDQLTEQGTLFVIGAGNSGPGPKTVGWPGTAASALTVAAVDGSDVVARFSSRGPRLDGGLKPDISAPGVAIVAARAAGTDMGAPVDPRYTAASGTSMAAPHVAGAAALVVQRHPGWTPEQVKAALMGTAHASPGMHPYDQGAGRVAVGAALDATVVPERGSVDLGLLRFPQPGEARATLGWRNDGTAEVTLDLTLALRGPAGAPVPQDQARLSASSVTVPAGGRAEVQLVADPRVTAPGQHAGHVSATVRGTDRTVRTVVGFTDEGPHHTLTVHGTNRAGQPATNGSVTVVDVEDAARFGSYLNRFAADGTVRLRVPAGRFHLDASILDTELQTGGGGLVVDTEMDARTRMVRPEIEVDADTVVQLDARTARPMSTRIERTRTETAARGLDIWRVDGAGNVVQFWGGAPGWWPSYYHADSSPVTAGSFDTAVTDQLTDQPRVSITTDDGPVRVAAPEEFPLPEQVGSQRLVDLGAGSVEDFQGRDVRGRVVLARRGLPVPEIAARARHAGATLLAILNDRPGYFRSARTAEVGMPTVIVDGADAHLLRSAAGGRIQVRTRPATVTYDLYHEESGGLPTPFDRVYTAADVRQLARVETTYHDPTGAIAASRIFSTPRGWALGSTNVPVEVPRRVEYVTPGYDVVGHLSWQHPVAAPGAPYTLQSWLRDPEAYTAAERAELHWLRGPLRPGVGGNDSRSISRTGDRLDVELSDVRDADGGFASVTPRAGAAGVSHTITLHRNGAEVGRVEAGRASFAVGPQHALYRLVAEQQTRDATPLGTSSRASWEFTSQAPNGTAMTVLPLPVFGVDAPVDARNRMSGRRLTVTAEPQPGLPEVRTRSVVVAYSIDDGRTWRTPARSRDLVNGAEVTLPVLPRGTTLSFRLQTTTTTGVEHEEVVRRALQVG